MEENITNPSPEAKKPPVALWAIVGVVILALVAFALSRNMGDEDGMSMMNEEEHDGMMTADMPDMGMTEAMQETMPADTMMSKGEAKVIAVEGGNFYFKPNEIRVKKGEKVKIVLTGKGMPHDFVVDELGVRTPIVQAGNTGTVEFTADKTGTFEYYCSVGQHRQNGMVGKLIVE